MNRQAITPEKLIDFTRYDMKATEQSDPEARNPIRNWSLMNRLNQKGTRPQGTPIDINELSNEEKAIVKRWYQKLIKN